MAGTISSQNRDNKNNIDKDRYAIRWRMASEKSASSKKPRRLMGREDFGILKE